MATFQKEIPASEFQSLIQELQRQPIAMNPDRAKSGPGRSQAFGVVKRMSYRPWVSRNCWMRPTLWRLIQEFADKHLPGFVWKACQVNMNYQSNPHKDKGNQNDSLIVGFGDYEGGNLVIDGIPYDIRHMMYAFNGSEKMHFNTAHAGTKYSMVFFDFKMPTWWPDASMLPTCEVFQRDGKDWLKVEDCDGAIYEMRHKNFITIQSPLYPLSRVGPVSSDMKAIRIPPSIEEDEEDAVGEP